MSKGFYKEEETKINYDSDDEISEDFSLCSEKTKPSSYDEEKNLLKSPKIFCIDTEDPSPYNLFGKTPTNLSELSERHFSLVSAQNGFNSCDNSEDEINIFKEDTQLSKIKKEMKKFFENFKKNKKESSDFESIYSKKYNFFNMLNEDNESLKHKHFKNLRKTIQRVAALRKNDALYNFRGSTPNSQSTYILSILEMNYKEINQKKLTNIRNSSKL
ncbi:MAG: hypothetical protein MJ252_13835 [archaeon]|nr:hypothetical protein [archaeon]